MTEIGKFQRYLPLASKTVLVTRPILLWEQPDRLASKLRRCGARAIAFPVIELRILLSEAEAVADLVRSNSIGCIAFFSRTGVHCFNEVLGKTGAGLADRKLPVKMAAIGPATASALHDLGVPVDLVPAEANSESMAELLLRETHGPVLLIRGTLGSDLVRERLTSADRTVHQSTVYENHPVATAKPEIVTKISNYEIGWITATSTSIAHSMVELFGSTLACTRIASISRQVSEVLEGSGFPPTVQATQPGFDSLVQAILAYIDHDCQNQSNFGLRRFKSDQPA